MECPSAQYRLLTAQLTEGLLEPPAKQYGGGIRGPRFSCAARRLAVHKVEPKGENKTHQNLALTICFADKSNAGAIARLQAGNAPEVVPIDYGSDKAVLEVAVLELEGGATIRSYSLHNVLAEKMRSLLQQPIRKRNHRQDVYDLWLLLDSMPGFRKADLARIHELLCQSCQSKGIVAAIHSMDDETVERMARKGYSSMQADLDHELPPFDDAMARVTGFYRSLPWG